MPELVLLLLSAGWILLVAIWIAVPFYVRGCYLELRKIRSHQEMSRRESASRERRRRAETGEAVGSLAEIENEIESMKKR